MRRIVSRGLMAVLLAGAVLLPAVASGSEPVSVCHFHAGQPSGWLLLELPKVAADRHLAIHDDGVPGGDVPHTNGEFIFTEECVPERKVVSIVIDDFNTGAFHLVDRGLALVEADVPGGFREVYFFTVSPRLPNTFSLVPGDGFAEYLYGEHFGGGLRVEYGSVNSLNLDLSEADRFELELSEAPDHDHQDGWFFLVACTHPADRPYCLFNYIELEVIDGPGVYVFEFDRFQYDFDPADIDQIWFGASGEFEDTVIDGTLRFVEFRATNG